MDPRSSLTERLAKSVQTAMVAAGYNAKTLAPVCGIPYTTLFRRLAGHSPFNTAELDQVSTALDTTPMDLMRAAEAMAAA